MSEAPTLRRFTTVGGSGDGWTEDCDDGDLCDGDEAQAVVDYWRAKAAEAVATKGEPNEKTPPTPDAELTLRLVWKASWETGLAFLHAFERRIRAQERDGGRR